MNENYENISTAKYVKNKLQHALNTFINHESFGGILLFVCVILAMIIANSKYSDFYFRFLHIEFGAFIGSYFIERAAWVG